MEFFFTDLYMKRESREQLYICLSINENFIEILDRIFVS